MTSRITAWALAICVFAFLTLVTIGAFAQPAIPETAIIPLATAQPAAPLVVPAADGSGWDLTPLLTNLQQFLAAVLTLVLTAVIGIIAKPINKYFGTKIEAEEVVKDLKMGDYANVAIAEALRYAKQVTGVSDAQLKDVEIRNPVLSMAAGFLFKQYPEIWRWVAQNEKGVMQYLEAHLAPDAALPANIVAGVGPVPPQGATT